MRSPVPNPRAGASRRSPTAPQRGVRWVAAAKRDVHHCYQRVALVDQPGAGPASAEEDTVTFGADLGKDRPGRGDRVRGEREVLRGRGCRQRGRRGAFDPVTDEISSRRPRSSRCPPRCRLPMPPQTWPDLEGFAGQGRQQGGDRLRAAVCRRWKDKTQRSGIAAGTHHGKLGNEQLLDVGHVDWRQLAKSLRARPGG